MALGSNPTQQDVVTEVKQLGTNSVTKTTASATVIGTAKSVDVIGGNQLVLSKGAVFSGTDAAAGLVTRGICGVSTPDASGNCNKENLYINYDSTNEYSVGRQVILQAGTAGTHYGSNLYQYAAARGDAVKGWVESKGYITSSGSITGSSGSCTGNAATSTNATNHIANTSNPHSVTASQVGALKVNPLGLYNANTIYDASVSLITRGSNLPTGAQYGSLLTMPYRQAFGNSIPDYATQLFMPNGDDPAYPDGLFYRTSLGGSWRSWKRVATSDDVIVSATLTQV